MCLCSCENEIRSHIKNTFHIYRPLPRVEDKVYGSFSPASGVTADRVSFATGYYLRVPAIVYHPSDEHRRRGPALIIVNGHGGDKSSWYAYWAGILYARAGGVVLTYDPIGEFERNHLRMSHTSQHDALLKPGDMARRMAGLMIEDILESVRYLKRRKDVDDDRIAVLGFSMGSFISSLACAVEPDVHACVLAGGGDLDGPGGYWDSSRKMCQAIPYQSVKFLGDRGAAIYALNAKRGPTLVYNGAADKVVDIPNHGPSFFADLQRRTLELLGGKNKDVFEYRFLPGGGHRPYFVTKPVALWLQEKLHFPKWSAAEIEAMPETYISEWAAANHLEGANFQNQLGEGGTMALGRNIPAVNRDLLHALPESVWEAGRRHYVYESWVTAAQAAIRSGAP